MKQETYNFLGPETHLGMIKTAVVIMTTHTVHKTMSTVCLASSTGLKLFVSLQLGVTEVVTRRDIVLPLPLLRLTRSTGFTLTQKSAQPVSFARVSIRFSPRPSSPERLLVYARYMLFDTVSPPS
jgi:hypothetical protein